MNDTKVDATYYSLVNILERAELPNVKICTKIRNNCILCGVTNVPLLTYLKRKKNNASNTKLLFCVTITCNGPLTWVITKESLVPIESDEKTYSSIYIGQYKLALSLVQKETCNYTVLPCNTRCHNFEHLKCEPGICSFIMRKLIEHFYFLVHVIIQFNVYRNSNKFTTFY